MKLLLIRHGQTPGNVAGQLDTAFPGPGLTELGERQAAALPEALADESIQAPLHFHPAPDPADGDTTCRRHGTGTGNPGRRP
ncbi:hypothetical protein StoSoilB13_29680 (plasmid) [Arthrobacter sp. StoSoilB13]|nr:hypothetical protein StoSoilB13_29680 [Arthrobacter sp. StoSoilB13]